MGKEFTFEEYTQALLGWSVLARNEYQSGKIPEMMKFLGFTYRSLKKVQWRRNLGLRDLPAMVETAELRRHLNEAQAAVEYLLEFGDSLAKNPQNERFRIKVESRLAMLIEVLQQARGIIKIRPWENPSSLQRPENQSALVQLLTRQGFYKKIELHEVVAIIHHLILVGHKFSGCNLKNANFMALNLRDANFSKANLTNAGFQRANLTGANFLGSDVAGANFTGSVGLTIGQLLQMRNVDRASGLLVPKDRTQRNRSETVVTDPAEMKLASPKTA